MRTPQRPIHSKFGAGWGAVVCFWKRVFFPLDLADPVSVGAFARQFLAEYDRLHLLFNNAGLMRLPQIMKDKRGYELQLGVNHPGHFRLTGRLWPALKSAGGARVVAYAQSKTANSGACEE